MLLGTDASDKWRTIGATADQQTRCALELKVSGFGDHRNHALEAGSRRQLSACGCGALADRATFFQVYFTSGVYLMNACE